MLWFSRVKPLAPKSMQVCAKRIKRNNNNNNNKIIEVIKEIYFHLKRELQTQITYHFEVIKEIYFHFPKFL